MPLPAAPGLQGWPLTPLPLPGHPAAFACLRGAPRLLPAAQLSPARIGAAAGVLRCAPAAPRCPAVPAGVLLAPAGAWRGRSECAARCDFREQPFCLWPCLEDLLAAHCCCSWRCCHTPCHSLHGLHADRGSPPSVGRRAPAVSSILTCPNFCGGAGCQSGQAQHSGRAPGRQAGSTSNPAADCVTGRLRRSTRLGAGPTPAATASAAA